MFHLFVVLVSSISWADPPTVGASDVVVSVEDVRIMLDGSAGVLAEVSHELKLPVVDEKAAVDAALAKASAKMDAAEAHYTARAVARARAQNEALAEQLSKAGPKTEAE